MKTKVIAQEAPIPPAAEPRVLVYEHRDETTNAVDGVMLYAEKEHRCIVLHSVFDHLPVGRVFVPACTPGVHYGEWTRIDGPITIQFNAP